MSYGFEGTEFLENASVRARNMVDLITAQEGWQYEGTEREILDVGITAGVEAALFAMRDRGILKFEEA